MALPVRKGSQNLPEFDSIVTNRFEDSSNRLANQDFTMHFPKGGAMLGSNAVVGAIPPLRIADEYTIFDSSQVFRIMKQFLKSIDQFRWLLVMLFK